MKISGTLIASLALSLTFMSCKEDVKKEYTPQVTSEIEFVVTNGDKEMNLYDHADLSTGFDFELQLFKAYISNIMLIKDDSSEVLLKDVEILELGKDNMHTVSFTIPSGSYTSLRVGYGLTPDQNNSDPTSFDESHPLSNFQSMHWPMIKYRFVKLEGFAKSLTDTTNYLVSMHPGTDPLYQVVSYKFDTPLEVTDGFNSSFRVSMDISDIFDGPAGVIDFSKDNANQVHMTPDDSYIGQMFMENMAAATKLELQIPLQ